MAYRGRGPEKSLGIRTYTRDKVIPKSRRTGYLAGDVHDLTCHVPLKRGDENTKPCERLLLGDNHPCPGCQKQRPTDWVGFVPLRDDTGKPVAIIIRKAVADVAGRLKPGSRVQWGRDAEQTDPVWLVEWPQGRPWEYWWPKQAPDDDMTDWLCVLWDTPHLAAALRRHWSTGGTAEPLPPAELPPGAKPWTGELLDTALRTEGYDPKKSKDERTRRNEEYAKRARTNGKH